MKTLATSPIDTAGILAYDVPGFIPRLARKLSISEAEAIRRFVETKKFLAVCSVLDGCSPSDEIDEVWHLFILHTQAYQRFCLKFLGRFIHHNPTETPTIGNRPQLAVTARELFGSIEANLWPNDGITACDDGGTSGDNYCSSGDDTSDND